MKSKNNIDKEIYSAPTTKEAIEELAFKTAMSETPEEEFKLDLIQTLSKYERWKRDNPGKSYDDFLEEEGLLRSKLSNGGVVEDYKDLIDAYEKGIDVKKGESLTDYIQRIKAAENK